MALQDAVAVHIKLRAGQRQQFGNAVIGQTESQPRPARVQGELADEWGAGSLYRCEGEGMDRNRLWAKSKRDDEPEHPSMLLLVHLAVVYEAAARVTDATGDDQLRELGLEAERYRDRLRRCVLLAAALHDLEVPLSIL